MDFGGAVIGTILRIISILIKINNQGVLKSAPWLFSLVTVVMNGVSTDIPSYIEYPEKGVVK